MCVVLIAPESVSFEISWYMSVRKLKKKLLYQENLLETGGPGTMEGNGLCSWQLVPFTNQQIVGSRDSLLASLPIGTHPFNLQILDNYKTFQ